MDERTHDDILNLHHKLHGLLLEIEDKKQSMEKQQDISNKAREIKLDNFSIEIKKAIDVIDSILNMEVEVDKSLNEKD